MPVRNARHTDFDHLETFVWQAIFPAFDRDGLNSEQRAENDALVEEARTEVLAALDREYFGVFVALDAKTRTLTGYLIVDARPRAYTEIVRLIVKRAYWGKGVASDLMASATSFVGRDRAVSVSVRHYNERALAFFAKHDFEDTGETTGDHAIPRSLLLREAYEDAKPLSEGGQTDQVVADNSAEEKQLYDDFPSAEDEPVFESLPNYNLTVEDAPLYETGQNALKTENLAELPLEETTLSESQLTELEAFIARARAKKGVAAPATADPVKHTKAKSAPKSSPPTPKEQDQLPTIPAAAEKADKPVFDRSKIEFEIDYGAAETPRAPITSKAKSSFEFAFDAGPAMSAPTQKTKETKLTAKVKPTARTASSKVEKNRTSSTPKPGRVGSAGKKQISGKKTCPDCQISLPRAARFCFSCGYPQPDPTDPDLGGQAPEEDQLMLRDLSEEADLVTSSETDLHQAHHSLKVDASKIKKTGGLKQGKPNKATPQSATPSSSPRSGQTSLADLKVAFRNHLQDRLLAYFGPRSLKSYLRRLEESAPFQQVRDGSLKSLAQWINDRDKQGSGVPNKAGTKGRVVDTRRNNILADLTEYFIVETAADLHGGILPQRLLRHQSVDWVKADLFRLVMDYLDFESESERVYTDFVVMPSRALKNATQSFLQAAKDERVFFICDQSLISQAKNGFALTDAGIYWKNVLQPPGQATFTTMQAPRLEQGHVIIDGQYFDAGGRLNLKMAVLLDKLRRVDLG